MRWAGAKRAWPAICLIGLVAAGLAPGAASQGAFPVKCAYVEAGAPGPRGNVLRVRDRGRSRTKIDRIGNEIEVSFSPTRRRLDCRGPTPTVTNLDRISYSTADKGVLAINGRGDGRLAPGASAEPGAPEIELHLRGTNRLNVNGTDGPDFMIVGRLGRDKVGVNMNSGSELNRNRSHADADVIMHARHIARVRIWGGGGLDEIGDRGGRGFSGPFSGGPIALFGNASADQLRGGDRRERIAGGAGDDRVFGFGGSDVITVGRGRDTVHGYGGADRITNPTAPGRDAEADRVQGEAGDDRIDVATGNGLTDRINCGGGTDIAVIDFTDEAENCERIIS